jgi:energy-coupling factor transporter ATP-binding protein EcfA2
MAPSLRDINLELRDGEVVGIVGASEAGKSTLCLVATGIAPRTIRGTLTGRLLIDGQDVVMWPMHALAARIGIGFQSPASGVSGVCGTVYEEVAFTPMNLGLPRDDVIDRTETALEALRITSIADRDPRRLSGGQMQLVALAGLLAMRPQHLVLDEPSAQLDPSGTSLVAEAVERLAADGASILIAEQKTDLLARVASRLVALDAGRIVLEGPAADILSDVRLEALGIPLPSKIRLRRALERAGLDATVLDQVPS